MTNYILTADGRLYHCDSSELYHYGVPGMKWGQRKQRVPVSGGGRRGSASQSSASSASAKAARDKKKSRVKKGVIIGAAVAGTALAAFGAYKLNKAINNKAWDKAYKIGHERTSMMFRAEMDMLNTTRQQGGKYTSTRLDRFAKTAGDYTRLDNRPVVREETLKAFNEMSYGDKVRNYANSLRRR